MNTSAMFEQARYLVSRYDMVQYIEKCNEIVAYTKTKRNYVDMYVLSIRNTAKVNLYYMDMLND
jgi:hypothetical protein